MQTCLRRIRGTWLKHGRLLRIYWERVVSKLLSYFLMDDRKLSDNQEIADEFNKYFLNIVNILRSNNSQKHSV